MSKVCTSMNAPYTSVCNINVAHCVLPVVVPGRGKEYSRTPGQCNPIKFAQRISIKKMISLSNLILPLASESLPPQTAARFGTAPRLGGQTSAAGSGTPDPEGPGTLVMSMVSTARYVLK